MKQIKNYIYNMKHIKNYINEKLHITTKSHTYSCQPKLWGELRDIIVKRIEEDGKECDLNEIDVSKIENMSYMFCASGNKIFENFNGDISRWDVSNVKYMDTMFFGCKKFNCDISKWDVSNVKNMNYMFYGCEQFNCDMSRWDVSNVERMQEMFKDCKNFNCDLSRWNVSNVKDMIDTFKGCPTKPEWYKE